MSEAAKPTETSSPAPEAQANAAQPTGETAKGSQAPVQNAQQAAPVAQEANKAAPAELSLKLPEGFQSDHPAVAQVQSMAKELGLSQEQAQKLFDRGLASEKAEQDAWSQQLKQWEDETKADPEIGGKNFEASRANVQRLMARFGNKAFEETLNKTGIGVHKSVFRFLAKVGAAMGEDRIAGTAAGASTQGQSQEATLRELYKNSPGMFEKT